MNSLVEQYIVDIIQKELELDPNNVWIRAQNMTIPLDENLYVIIGCINSNYIGSVNSYDSVTGNEVQEVTLADTIQIDWFSKSTDALTRRWEILAALNSFYSKQVQESNNFKIFKQPNSFVNTSSIEGSDNITRFTAQFVCHVCYIKEKMLQSFAGDYYDDFNHRVDDENTIGGETGLIEFEITGE